MIRNFPSEIVNSESIKKHFEELIETNPLLKQDVQRVKAKRKRRRTLSLEGQAAVASALAGLDLEVDLNKNQVNDEIMTPSTRQSGALNYEDLMGDGVSPQEDMQHDDMRPKDQTSEETSKGKEKDFNELDKKIDINHDHDGLQHKAHSRSIKENVSESESEVEQVKKPTVVAVHVAWEVRDVLNAKATLEDIEDQLQHYRREKQLHGQRPLVWFPPASSLFAKLVYLFLHFTTIMEGILYGGARGRLDAIRELKRKKVQQESEVIRAKKRAREARATGVVFVTFSSSVVAKVPYSLW